MKKPTARTIVQQGFSLVELLVVIAVIAVIAAIAIPNIANITGAAGDAKNQRNAQNIANLAAAARAAGVTNSIDSPEDWLDALEDGISGPTGTALQDTSFRIDTLSGPDRTGALEYITMGPETDMTKSTLVYNPAGTTQSNN